MSSDSHPDNSLRAVLVRDRWRIFILLAIAAVLLVFFGLDLPAAPREVRLFAMAAVAAGLLGYPWSRRIVDWLYRPTHTYIVDFDAQTDEIAVWKLPASSWRDLDIREYELHPLQAASPAWEGKNYDPDTNAVDGTWRGSATDRELIETRAAVNEVRTELRKMAQEGLVVRVRQSTLVRQAVADIVTEFVRDFEAETTYSGEQLQDAIDEAIESWELDGSPQKETDGTQDDRTDAEPNAQQFVEDIGSSDNLAVIGDADSFLSSDSRTNGSDGDG